MKVLQSVIAFFLLISIFSGCAKSRAEKEIKTKDNNVSIRIEGSTYPIQKQELISSVPGYINEIFIKDGDKVNVGDLIFSLDKELINLDIENKKSEIASLESIRDHKTQKQTAEKNIPAINLAAIELRKVAALQAKGYVHGFEENQYRKNYINAIYDNNNNENQDNYEKNQNINSEIMRKQVELKKLEYQLKHADGYAPISGYISNFNINLREHIQENQKICSIIDFDYVIVRAGFATGLLPFIQEGQLVDITFITVPTYKVVAKVSKINPIVDPQFNSMTIDIIVKNNNYLLQEGTKTLVNISLTKEGQDAVKKYFRSNSEETTIQISSDI